MEQNLYKLTRRSGSERGIVALPETLGEAIDELAGSDLVRRALGDHIFARLREAQAAGVGRVPGAAHALGAGEVPRGLVTRCHEA